MQDSLRYLVLKLHSLNNKERQWILSKLSILERNKVEKLLNEVDAIKNSYNKNVVSQSLQGLAEGEQNNRVDSGNGEKLLLQKLIKKVDRLESEKIVSLLAAEEPWIISLIVSLNQWSWLKDLENCLSNNKKLHIQQWSNHGSIEVKQDVIIVILKLIIDSVNENASAAQSQHIISFDEFTNFTGSRIIDSNKNWWRELWHS